MTMKREFDVENCRIVRFFAEGQRHYVAGTCMHGGEPVEAFVMGGDREEDWLGGFESGARIVVVADRWDFTRGAGYLIHALSWRYARSR
jgi:hypothetical protein